MSWHLSFSQHCPNIQHEVLTFRFHSCTRILRSYNDIPYVLCINVLPFIAETYLQPNQHGIEFISALLHGQNLKQKTNWFCSLWGFSGLLLCALFKILVLSVAWFRTLSSHFSYSHWVISLLLNIHLSLMCMAKYSK